MAERMKTAVEVRREAARLARSWAEERDDCGDPEGAGCFRDLARQIDAIRIRAKTQGTGGSDND